MKSFTHRSDKQKTIEKEVTTMNVYVITTYDERSDISDFRYVYADNPEAVAKRVHELATEHVEDWNSGEEEGSERMQDDPNFEYILEDVKQFRQHEWKAEHSGFAVLWEQQGVWGIPEPKQQQSK
jgi:hypothetical protein